MINNVVLVGRLTRDPELRKTQSGISVVNFTLAVNRSFQDQSGETQADFINCIAWRNQAENLARYMRKGSLIGVEGRIQTGSYETDEGTRYTTDVVANRIQFLESRNQQQPQQQNFHGYEEQTHPSDNNQNRDEKKEDDYYTVSQDIISDDDLPF